MRTNDWGRLGSCYLVAFLIERCCFSNTCSTSRASQGATALSKFPNTVSGIGMAKATSDQFNFQVSSGLRQLVALPPECSRSESLLFKRGDLKLTSENREVPELVIPSIVATIRARLRKKMVTFLQTRPRERVRGATRAWL